MTSYFPEGTRSFVSLRITSDALTPEEIGRSVGVRPDRAWKKGDLRGYPASSMIPRKNSGWVLDSGLEETDAFERHLESLLDRAAPSAAGVRKLSEENDVTLSCAVYLPAEDGSSPPLYFGKEIVARVCALGANLDVQLYLSGVTVRRTK